MTKTKIRRLADTNYEVKRTKNELGIDFMLNYIENKCPDKMDEFLENATTQAKAKEFFIENCPEIIKAPAPQLTFADKVANKRKERGAANVVPMLKAVNE